ncbi:MAG: quinolinate synthase NadA [Fusobacterium mortiferum]|jgi:quinolinate synthase|uniref:Quinolinate synthase n=1 Tax=Fusobacterium mortiferum TaxID=850 RepID=A0A414Q2Q8_FUSMR|nr:quinolinate synthase NadA [Fusobacterium mortiferum]MCF2626810.1 quinolinate synthase NadA [Fusobacterium mortiferum]MCF2698103.1 quinolinate synthase NadA [Fusobacterium mortiferum]MCI6381247.1 quinolinate synthase NadA [Fusobacterium mortiferum]MCI7188657.1 quinolinate synthase NadA [Fusobacterium mortiferum]MCI7666185.1 quinolinate synthase NadA [Fusobacterium mortiferum]
MNKIELIKDLKKKKKAVILAHYYTEDEIQKIADYIGDSYFLSKKAKELKEQVIVMCGVYFMGESVKLLNPNKKVIIPDKSADCPMAHMATLKSINEMRKKYEDLSVVCYVNSTVQLKALSDVCVTSANAVDIVKKLPNRNIFFIPDKHLGNFVASKVPEKNIIINDGYCPIHDRVEVKDIIELKEKYPQALVMVHPECSQEILELADYIGSTSGIIDFVSKSKNQDFIICTEIGILYELKNKNPNKNFYSPKNKMECLDMKKITLDKIIQVLETEENEIILDLEVAERAKKPLEKMLVLGR